MDPLLFDSPLPADLAEDGAWWSIYERSFPQEEREPRDVILRSLEATVGLAFRARRASVTIAIATTHLLLHPPAAFLVYLAVDPQHRRSGVGAAMLEFAWSESAERLRKRGHDPLGLIWEVDPPGMAEDPTEETQRHRRVAFFQRQGGLLLSRPYHQPPVNGTRAVPMRLMMRPAPGLAPPARPVIEALVHAIYFEKYGAINRLPDQTLQDLLSVPA